MNDGRGIEREIEAVYRTESRRVLATLIRLLGDFDLAEEALHDAFRAAARAVAARRRARQSARLAGVGRALQGDRRHPPARALRRARRPNWRASIERGGRAHGAGRATSVEDDRLRLIFTCCHPALPPDAQVALTLREVCGLTTEEIARAFLTGAPTLAQRIVRAKAKIRDARHPLPGAGAGGAARAARQRAARHLPGVQRGLLGVLGRRR